MAVWITATYNGSYHSPGFDLVVTGLSSYDNILIERIDGSGVHPATPVRGADGVALSGASFGISDYEAPIGLPLTYKATAYTDSTSEYDETDDPVTISSPGPGAAWLRAVGQPALSRRVNVSDWSDTSIPTRILGEYEVLGRPNKVVITDTFGGREGRIVLTTLRFNGTWESDCSHQDIRQLLTLGGTLLFQSSGEDLTGEQDMYLEVKGWSRKRIGPVGGDFIHLHEIEFVEVDRPATTDESLTLRTWQSVLDQNASWDDVLSNYGNWLDVLQRDL